MEVLVFLFLCVNIWKRNQVGQPESAAGTKESIKQALICLYHLINKDIDGSLT